MSDNVNYRDRYGRLIDKELWYEERFSKNKKKIKEFVQDKVEDEDFLKYKGGIVQYNKSIDKQKEYSSTKSLIDGGNYYIDEKYDEELRKKIHWDDPINIMNRRFNEKEKLNINYDSNKLKCKYMTPQNRFSIESGYRWDGVVRGNGFEEMYLLKQSENSDRKYL
ncbi:hypothetical protein FG386_001392 [Cryptosporidium ryanae]|uniref:uncharacterized protein n=1 Tax=Cryptosporidium ryanae TaxID=515981 RepID=UPI003519E90B|nr:hypothetical protein FG386_001392 [Cryptosporidium ryanae]